MSHRVAPEACCRKARGFRAAGLLIVDEPTADLDPAERVRSPAGVAALQRFARFGMLARLLADNNMLKRVAWLDGLLFDLRLAFRGLRRDRGFSLTAVSTLSVAIALNVTVFTVMDAMLFRGLPLAKRSDRLVYLAMRKPSDLPCCPGPVLDRDVEAWRAQAHALEGIAVWRSGEPITFRDGEGRPIDMILSRWSFNTLRLIGVRPELGRDFVAADEIPGAPAVALISHAFWERQFGKRADIVGMTVHINGAPTTIIGVLPERFALLYEQDLWMPLAPMPALEGNVFGRLRDDATIEEARVEIDTITHGLQAADPGTTRGAPLVRTYSQAHVAADAPMIYGSLWAGAWFVLLIACANLANLTLVRTIGRWREFSTRIALGAGQSRMVRQMLGESLALAGVAAPLAWWITKLSIRVWEDMTKSRYLALDYTVNSSTLAYLATISLAGAILIALVPIARVMQLGVDGPLKGDARGVTHGLRGKHLTAWLVAGQMALAVVLLLGAGVLVRSFDKIVRADTGVRNPERIMVGRLRLPSDKYPAPAARTEFLDRVDAQLRTLAGSEDVSISSMIPTRGVNPRRVEIDGRPGGLNGGESVQVLTVGPEYFRVMGQPMISGRDFNKRDDAAAPLVVMVNQSFADTFWPGEDLVGKRLRTFERETPGPWRAVVGIVPNVMQGDATRQSFKPVVYVPFRQQPFARPFVLVRTSVPPNLLTQAVRAEIHKLDGHVLVEELGSLKSAFAFDRDNMDLEHADLGKYAVIAPVFAVIALVLAAVGLVAVIAHAVGQRTKEIGIRMAIGAANQDIARMIVREGMRPVAIGLLAGLVASAGANRILQSQLVGISPYDPLTMAAGPIVLIAVALIACHIPARRAMHVDPVVALRHD
jgi:putative ABC transport system permease protein